MAKKATKKTTTTSSTKKSKEVQEGLACAILSYFLVGIIWYFADENMKKNTFARFHAQQGLALLILYVALAIVSAILFFLGFLWMLVGIGLFVLWLIGLIRAATGERAGPPLVDKLAEKLNI